MTATDAVGAVGVDGTFIMPLLFFVIPEGNLRFDSATPFNITA